MKPFFLSPLLQKLGRSRAGATAIEYGVIVALIAIAIIPALMSVGIKLRTIFPSVGGSL